MTAAKSNAILIVEDDENLRIALRDNLEDEGYSVVEAAALDAARTALSAQRFDLLVLDVMLPDGDGYSLCRELRAAGEQAKILMLTARTLEDDLVTGLDAGADDYLTKPYRLRELMARVRALLRRGATGATETEVLTCGEFRLDLRSREAFAADGQVVNFTRTEFDLLCHLVRNPGRAMTRQEILGDVWGRDVVVDDRTVDNFVSSIKKKLGWNSKSRFVIRTVRGVGYRFDLTD